MGKNTTANYLLPSREQYQNCLCLTVPRKYGSLSPQHGSSSSCR